MIVELYNSHWEQKATESNAEKELDVLTLLKWLSRLIASRENVRI